MTFKELKDYLAFIPPDSDKDSVLIIEGTEKDGLLIREVQCVRLMEFGNTNRSVIGIFPREALSKALLKEFRKGPNLNDSEIG